MPDVKGTKVSVPLPKGMKVAKGAVLSLDATVEDIKESSISLVITGVYSDEETPPDYKEIANEMIADDIPPAPDVAPV